MLLFYCLPQESLDFSPDEFVFAHHFRNPLSEVDEARSSDEDTTSKDPQNVAEFKRDIQEEAENILQNIPEFKSDKWEKATENLQVQEGME